MGLEATTGTTRSGKSFFVENTWKKDNPNGIVFTTDQLRLCLHGERYASQAEELIYSLKWIFLKTVLADNPDKPLMVCGTHTTENSIRKLLSLDPYCKFHVFTTDPIVCQERALATNQPDVLPVIWKHWKNLVELGNCPYQLSCEMVKNFVENRIEKIRKEVLGVN